MDPPFSRVGLSEEEARSAGYDLKIARIPAAAIPKAQVLRKTDGLLKVIIDAKTDQILGAHFFCEESHEMINLIKLRWTQTSVSRSARWHLHSSDDERRSQRPVRRRALSLTFLIYYNKTPAKPGVFSTLFFNEPADFLQSPSFAQSDRQFYSFSLILANSSFAAISSALPPFSGKPRPV